MSNDLALDFAATSASMNELNRVLRDLAEIQRRDFPEVVRQSGRTLARELARETYPLGIGATSKKMGQSAVGRDIGRVYVTPGTIYEVLRTQARPNAGSRLHTATQFANAFAKALESGDTDGALGLLQASGLDQRQGWQNITIGAFDGGVAHRKRRSKSTGRVQGLRPTRVLTKKTGLNAYIKKQKAKAGLAKAVWAQCSALLGSTRGFPAWLTKIMSGTGKVDNHLKSAEPHVILKSVLGYESSALPSEGISRAARFAAGKMEKMLRIVTEKEVAKFNRRTY